MRVVPINEAESIIEPYWDGGSSEHPKDKLSLLDHYRVRVPSSVRGGVRQIWCAVVVELEHAEPGCAPIVMERDCDIPIEGYDVLRLFASVPSWVVVNLGATIDGQDRSILSGLRGTDTNDEIDGPISGRRLTALRLEFSVIESRPASLNLLWMGLANKRKQAEMEARSSPYDPEWEGLLVGAKEASEGVGAFRPEIGMLFGPAELAALRRNVRSSLLRDEYEALRAQAVADLDLRPEEDVGQLIGKPDRRWCRNRDMKKVQTAGLMERLAFVGLMERDVAMSRMAARMALSAAHCEYWCESVMGVFPGASWHHRSFTEEVYCRACALVLDWAGFCLTPAAKQVIRDAIVMKGLGRIESDFKRMEYIRHMNQGIVFSSGRIFGALSLLPAYPRYASLLDEAERDLTEMIDAYVRADGGTLEGMGYWSYTFSSVMPTVLALARHRGKSLLGYGRANKALRRTGDYGLGMLSSTGDGTTYTPVNDAHGGFRYPAGLVAAYVKLSGRAEWKALYRAMAHSRSLQVEEERRRKAAGVGATTRGVSHGGDAPDLYHLILAPLAAELRGAAPVLRERFDAFPAVGEVTSARRLGSGGPMVQLHFSSGPTYQGHAHEDKGSFILEVDGEPVIYDRGVTSYDHPEVNLIGIAARHNVLYPEAPDGSLMRQPRTAPGGRLLSAAQKRGRLMLAGDTREAWEDGVFATSMRRVFSPSPELFIIDDEVVLARAMALSFRVNSPRPIEVRGDALLIPCRAGFVEVRPVGWRPARVAAAQEGIDCSLRPAYLGSLSTEVVRRARILTAVRVVHAGDHVGTPVVVVGRSAAERAEGRLVEVLPRAGRLDVRELDSGRVAFKARCVRGAWTIG